MKSSLTFVDSGYQTFQLRIQDKHFLEMMGVCQIQMRNQKRFYPIVVADFLHDLAC